MNKKTILERNIWGVPLGKYNLFLRYASQTFYTELEGELSDATTLFTNPDLQEEFKDIVCEGLDNLQSSYTKKALKNVTPGKSELVTDDDSSDIVNVAPVQGAEAQAVEDIKKSFLNFNFAHSCRVLILQENFSKSKHLILQVGRLHSITEYACYNNSSHWGIAVGVKSMGKVDGLGLTMPVEYELPEIGEVMIHIFCPDDPRGKSDDNLQSSLKGAVVLSKIVPFIPQALNIKSHLAAKDRIISTLESSLKKMEMDMGEMRTRLNAALRTLQRSGPDGEIEDWDKTDGPSVVSVACYFFPSLVFGGIGFAFEPLAVFIGVAAGIIVGAVADSKRR